MAEMRSLPVTDSPSANLFMTLGLWASAHYTQSKVDHAHQCVMLMIHPDRNAAHPVHAWTGATAASVNNTYDWFVHQFQQGQRGA